MDAEYVLSKLTSRFSVDDYAEFEPYTKLRELFQSEDKVRFERLFSKYYGLNSAGLSEDWRAEYFRILWNAEPVNEISPYFELLLRLKKYPRKIGDRVLQFSFVSKLVSFHDESFPIFDRHVSNFFGISTPRISDEQLRVTAFTSNLLSLRKTYSRIADLSQMKDVRDLFGEKNATVESVHLHRIIDFMVWNFGRKEKMFVAEPEGRRFEL